MSINTNTTVNPKIHSVVVVIDDAAIGFISLHRAIRFIEETYAGEEFVKLYNLIAEAMSDDKPDNLQIFDMETYSDLFMDEDENEDEDEEADV